MILLAITVFFALCTKSTLSQWRLCNGIKCCESLQKPANGDISTCKAPEPCYVGSVIVFTCDPGYMLEGTGELICQTSYGYDSKGVPDFITLTSRFNNPPPKCVKITPGVCPVGSKCCKPLIEPLHTHYSNCKAGSAVNCPIGSVVTASCDPISFDLDGSAVFSCIEKDGKAVYSPKPPSCPVSKMYCRPLKFDGKTLASGYSCIDEYCHRDEKVFVFCKSGGFHVGCIEGPNGTSIWDRNTTCPP